MLYSLCARPAIRGLRSLTAVAYIAVASACAEPGPDDPGGSTGDDTYVPPGPDEYIGGGQADCSPSDTSTCMPAATDYLPTNTAADTYPACISDGGVYQLVSDPPSSIGRVEAFEQMGTLLWSGGIPSTGAFVEARATYEIEEGLKSRLERREDLHYPPIPEADWDPGFDPDKQCSVIANVEKYPDRCAGPAQINPLLTRALLDGAAGVGDPRTHAARIEAAGLWFLYISVYKEAYTCTATPKDCDSSWAYYAGGAQSDGALIGFAKQVAAASPPAHQRIFDGVLAVRCFRDLYDPETYPTYDDLPAEGKHMFDTAWEQLDNALHAGYAAVVRGRIQRLSSCGDNALTAVHWEFVRTAGPILNREANERDATLAAELAAAWALELPTLDDLAKMVALLDALFPCP